MITQLIVSIYYAVLSTIKTLMLQMYQNCFYRIFVLKYVTKKYLEDTFDTHQIFTKVVFYNRMFSWKVTISTLKCVTNVSNCVARIMEIHTKMPKGHIFPIKPSEKSFFDPEFLFCQMYHFLILKSVTFVSFIVNNFRRLVTAFSLM